MPVVMRVQVERQGAGRGQCHRCRDGFANHIGDFSDSAGRATSNEAATVLQPAFPSEPKEVFLQLDGLKPSDFPRSTEYADCVPISVRDCQCGLDAG